VDIRNASAFTVQGEDRLAAHVDPGHRVPVKNTGHGSQRLLDACRVGLERQATLVVIPGVRSAARASIDVVGARTGSTGPADLSRPPDGVGHDADRLDGSRWDWGAGGAGSVPTHVLPGADDTVVAEFSVRLVVCRARPVPIAGIRVRALCRRGITAGGPRRRRSMRAAPLIAAVQRAGIGVVARVGDRAPSHAQTVEACVPDGVAVEIVAGRSVRPVVDLA
jgi:hypothetical protein